MLLTGCLKQVSAGAVGKLKLVTEVGKGHHKNGLTLRKADSTGFVEQEGIDIRSLDRALKELRAKHKEKSEKLEVRVSNYSTAGLIAILLCLISVASFVQTVLITVD